MQKSVTSKVNLGQKELPKSTKLPKNESFMSDYLKQFLLKYTTAINVALKQCLFVKGQIHKN